MTSEPSHAQVHVASTIVLDDLGRALMEYRTSGTDTGWGFPGGVIEDGETLEQAALRELDEEVGIVEVGAVRSLDLTIPIARPAVGVRFELHFCQMLDWRGAPQLLEPRKRSAIGWFDPFVPPDHALESTLRFARELARQTVRLS